MVNTDVPCTPSPSILQAAKRCGPSPAFPAVARPSEGSPCAGGLSLLPLTALLWVSHALCVGNGRVEQNSFLPLCLMMLSSSHLKKYCDEKGGTHRAPKTVPATAQVAQIQAPVGLFLAVFL